MIFFLVVYFLSIVVLVLGGGIIWLNNLVFKCGVGIKSNFFFLSVLYLIYFCGLFGFILIVFVFLNIFIVIIFLLKVLGL